MSKKYKIAIFIAIIGAAGVITAAVIQRQAANSSAESKPIISQQTDSGTNNNAGRDINQAGRDNISAGRDVTVFNVDTFKHGEKIIVKKEQPKTVIDQSVTTHNQTGGIAAHTVVVPEDKEIPLIDNFEVNIKKNGTGYFITVNPKHGQWYPMCISFPLKEEESNKIVVGSTKGGVLLTEEGITKIPTTSDSIEFKFFRMNEPCTSKIPYFIRCEALPSHIFFGEFGNKDKVFHKQF